MNAPALPLLEPFPTAAGGDDGRMLYVNAEASLVDLWEECAARMAYASDLADTLSEITGDVPGKLALALASVTSHLLKEAETFHRMVYVAAARERRADVGKNVTWQAGGCACRVPKEASHE